MIKWCITGVIVATMIQTGADQTWAGWGFSVLTCGSLIFLAEELNPNA